MLEWPLFRSARSAPVNGHPFFMTTPTKPAPEFSGRYMHTETRELYQLAVVPVSEVRQQRTHLCKSATRFWDGTEADFLRLFQKV